MARNTLQVLGPNCDEPSDFIVCWTENANGNGGTGQAIRIAKAHNIPVFDFGKSQEAWDAFCNYLNEVQS